MKKKEFLCKLEKKLSALPKQERKERLNFYSEAIDDRIEEGLTEAEAVKAMGSLEQIAAGLSEDGGSEQAQIPKKEKKLGAFGIAAAIVGSPIWVPLLIAALVIYASFYVIVWSIITVFWVLEIPFLIISFISKFLLIFCKEGTRAAIRFTRLGFRGVFGCFKKVKK